MAKKAAKRTAVPYSRIATMWREGFTYETMAKAVKRYHPNSDDPTKHIRAICSTMLTKGYKNADGKKLKLQPRQGMRAIGVGKKVQPKKALKGAA